ncbi:hypothetical protein CDD83_2299 [Cordyceps sp. RAO-2017]|nr:hypothetical protein CDD83_2299 [Cordyceps sp. RAO-2017]
MGNKTMALIFPSPRIRKLVFTPVFTSCAQHNGISSNLQCVVLHQPPSRDGIFLPVRADLVCTPPAGRMKNRSVPTSSGRVRRVRRSSPATYGGGNASSSALRPAGSSVWTLLSVS